MVVTIPQNEENSKDGKIGERKGVCSAISHRRANRETINI